MKLRKIFTESPEIEQWRLLLRYSYRDNIVRHFTDRGLGAPSDEQLDTISGSVLQAREYYEASKVNSLQISPLLLYYGASHLFYAFVHLFTNIVILIDDHGMKLFPPAVGAPLGKSELKPRNPATGSLAIFHKALGADESSFIIGKGNWSLSELLGSVPDLFDLYMDCYPHQPFVLPVEVQKDGSGVIERIRLSHLQRVTAGSVHSLIVDYSSNYLVPQQTSEYLVCRRKLTYTETGIFALSGNKFINLYHVKGTQRLDVPLELIIFMGLFILGSLCRYHPSVWTPFVLRDITGERHIIETFLDIARRTLPNLILNRLNSERIVFVNERINLDL